MSAMCFPSTLTGRECPAVSLARVLRRRRRPADDPLAHVDPRLVPPRFAPAVTGALAARARFGEAVVDQAEVAAGIDAAVLGMWEAARRAGEIGGTVADDAEDRLRSLAARLDAAADGTDMEDVQQELADVVTELDALRVALRELG